MAYQRKPLTARRCAQCGDPYQAVDRRRLYCCPACKTAASQARRPSAAEQARRARQSPEQAPLTSPAEQTLTPASALPVEAAASTLAAPAAGPPNPSFGKLVAATAAGNLLTDVVKALWAPTAAAGQAPASGWPTWPPAELLAATGPPVCVSDPSWHTPQWLTPLTYHRHQLYLCLEEGVTVVLRKEGPGRWHYVRTPAQLAQLAAQPPLAPGIQVLMAQYASGWEQPLARPNWRRGRRA
jgi:hypothetical protein